MREKLRSQRETVISLPKPARLDRYGIISIHNLRSCRIELSYPSCHIVVCKRGSVVLNIMVNTGSLLSYVVAVVVINSGWG